MNDQNGRYARLRYTATGAIAALATAGAIAGAVALAASPPAKTSGHAAAATSGVTKPQGAPVEKSRGQAPAAGPQLFLNAVQRLVDNGAITAAEAQVVDREIQAGRVDTDTLAAAGFTPAQRNTNPAQPTHHRLNMHSPSRELPNSTPSNPDCGSGNLGRLATMARGSRTGTCPAGILGPAPLALYTEILPS